MDDNPKTKLSSDIDIVLNLFKLLKPLRCLHVSTRLAVLRTKPAIFEFNYDCLTPREAQIADLVAQGMTNKEIGTELWITENSVKQAEAYV